MFYILSHFFINPMSPALIFDTAASVKQLSINDFVFMVEY